MEGIEMHSYIKISVRNIRRNKRRSFVTLAAIAVGFAALSLFRGYIDNTYSGLRDSAIKGEGLGHFMLYKTGWLEKGKTDPEPYMFSQEELEKTTRLVEEEEDVVLATPQLHISGLVSNGKISTIFMAKGVVPKDDKAIRGSWAANFPVKGGTLEDRTPFGVEMAEGLADLLSLGPGQDGVVMATTLEGQMNAMDIRVLGVFDSGSDATNDKVMRIPFALARSLYDTEKADRVVVLLDDWRKTETVRDRLLAKLEKAGIRCEIRTWQELSLFYGKVRGMFDMIFLFLFCIVLVIVVMSTVNTMGMAVLERTREIGTLRALGIKRRGITLLFGLLGCAGGLGLNVLVWAAIRAARPTYIPPGVSTSVPLIVNLVPQVMAGLALFIVILALFAAILPARRAARQNVVEALAHV
jgi:putative ABC transport system permease protein